MAAKAAQKPVARMAADLIRSGLEGGNAFQPSEIEHPLVARVLEMFAQVEGVDAEAQREAALVLARVAALGGPPAVGAVKELRAIFAEIDQLIGHVKNGIGAI
jgi:hypothetical protein